MDGNQKGSSLFVGNLSMFIKEEDIESLFDQYSIESEFGSERIFAKIIRTEFGISRGYGFIEMWNEGDAKKAMINLHGKQFHGRALKVKYSERNASKKDDDIGASEKDGKNSVHVRFSSTNRGYLITEEIILRHFSKCGKVVHVSIKQSEFNKLNGLHRGYAFVHFEESTSGKDSAIRATTEVPRDSLVLFECQPSHNLTKQLEKLSGIGLMSSELSETKKKSHIPQHPSRIVSHLPFTAPCSSSLRKIEEPSQSSYVDDDQHTSSQLVYPYPHPGHRTPFMAGQNLGTPRYMMTENQQINSNIQLQQLRQQYNEQQHYQMNFQSGYPSHYYPGYQTISIQLRTFDNLRQSPLTMQSMPRYSTEFPYHSDLRQQMPYVTYSTHPLNLAYNPSSIPMAYNSNQEYEQLQQYYELNSPQQIYPSPASSTYISSTSQNQQVLSQYISSTSLNQQLPLRPMQSQYMSLSSQTQQLRSSPMQQFQNQNQMVQISSNQITDVPSNSWDHSGSIG